jgi:hypothetical protein
VADAARSLIRKFVDTAYCERGNFQCLHDLTAFW